MAQDHAPMPAAADAEEPGGKRWAGTPGSAGDEMASKPQPESYRQDRGFGQALTQLKRPGFALVLCRWRYEIATVGMAVAVIASAVCWVGIRFTLAGVAVLTCIANVAAVRPGIRRAVVARIWCLITPHRVRTCFAQAWVYNRAGQIPAVLRATATPLGERVVIWCRPGTSFEDVDSACGRLAAACWAVEVTASRNSRFAQLVYLDVIRHPHGQTATRAVPARLGSDQLRHYRPGEGFSHRRPFDVPEGPGAQDAA
jgi:hypothetical protein